MQLATVSSTIYYSSRFPNLRYKKLGKTGFTVSACGFGCYRVDDTIIEHHQSLEHALEHGINLIDTSSNYSNGGSEKLVGNVVNKLISEEKIVPDDVILVTKGGYIQGENLTFAKEREADGNPFPEIVKCSPELWHCIHSDFIKEQLTQSLERLQLKKVDIYLIHNPEYFLTYSDISSKDQRTTEYYRRIEQIFKHLESEVNNNRISYYGVSSNTFFEQSNKNNVTSFERIYKIASSISENNHFAVIQFPMNLLEKGAALNKNQANDTKTLLQFAKEKNLGVLTNRPLNAISNNKIIRLSDFEIKEDRTREEIKEMILKINRYEKTLIDKYVNKMSKDFNEKKNLLECLSLGKMLDENYDQFESPNHFNDIRGYYLIPRANFAIGEINKFFRSEDSLVDILDNYAVTINITLDSIESELARQWNEKNDKLKHSLNDYLTSKQKNLTFSQKAIAFINSCNDISSTLVGMRKIEYVNDVLEGMSIESDINLKNFWIEKSVYNK